MYSGEDLGKKEKKKKREKSNYSLTRALKIISDWIYVNMASVSVYRSYAKCVLSTKTLILPTQDNGWLSAPPTELCNYHDNHSQQRPDSAGWGKVRTRYLPVKASSEHCCLLKGLCQNSPLPTPLVLTPRPDPPPPVRAVPGLSSCTDQDSKPSTFLDTPLAWSQAKPNGKVLTKSDRYNYLNG